MHGYRCHCNHHHWYVLLTMLQCKYSMHVHIDCLHMQNYTAESVHVPLFIAHSYGHTHKSALIWAHSHGHTHMGILTWAHSHGHTHMGTHSHGHTHMGTHSHGHTLTWAHSHGHTHMGTLTWAHSHGHTHMGTLTWTHISCTWSFLSLLVAVIIKG